MKIQSSLVFDKCSGDLIGFIDFGDPMVNFAYVEEETFASHALAFLVRGLCTDLKHIIPYFFTKDLTSFQLMPLFWRAVSILELSLQLYVCAAVNDGASANRKFFRLHSQLAQDLKCDVVYKTRNVFAMSRFIYFFAYLPHLIKTARNCLYNSGSGSCSRYMWNNGQFLLFRHIADLFYSDQEFALNTLPKLTMDHIVLTPYSKMKVKLAMQVLSKSVMISLHGKEDVQETASWKNNIATRPGTFSADERGKMFLSPQTYERFKISVYSHVEAIQFLLEKGFQYVLTERFMQDVLEDYFGHQRNKGARSDNPTAQQFGYNDLTIASQ
ncbi:Hypothetical predicted protein [Paramuricea clavata]|uniref:Uncharacterized protein n=1 Tax=Paramuricea clavata TaxID=317549 RepID=A0A6S7HKG6_PARCT|nr:Hypothetical predicted protein [Paramuricea clavata]